jgi:transposase-like protein
MTLIALTDCCRRLSIDPKTLHRWLAQAQFSAEAHPADARSKGLTRDQLLLLATAHRRTLAPLPEERPAPVPTGPPQEPPLPRELLDLLQTLTALPAQIAALQQQLAGLTQVLHPLPPQPPVTACHAHDGGRFVGQPTPAKASARSRPCASSATKPPRPPAHVLPLVEYGTQGHYVVICPKQGLLPLEPDTPAWFAWLATLSSFRFVGRLGRLTAHRESQRVPGAAWRAHRKIRNHTYNQRLGQTQCLTIAVLEQAAAALHSHLK